MKLRLYIFSIVILAILVTACIARNDTRHTQSGGSTLKAANNIAQEQTNTGNAAAVAPEQTATSQQVDIVSMPSPVYPGSAITVFAKATPDATCTVQVGYRGGKGEEKAFVAKQTEQNGLVSWTWQIDSSVPFGIYPITVTAQSGTGEPAVVQKFIDIESKAQCNK
ncbi:MAG TPA: hypothetical protein VGK02_12445 [Candidatus Aquicultor sp.]|jgi:hypothetical protein